MSSYSDLTKAERSHWDEYQTLREISDWLGFDAAQEERKQDARKWLVDRRKEIWRSAQKKPKGDGKGWNVANRRERYDFLRDDNLNKGAPKHEVRLPAPGVCTNAEKVYIEEREGYLAFASQTPEQKERKLANLNWLVNRRKQLYRLIKEDKTEGREKRYEALCIATSHGSAYKSWDKKHNKWGVPHGDKPEGGGRNGIVHWCNKYVGVKESPAGSNRGEPQPGGWMRRVYGGTGIPWCACFTVCSAWDAGIKGSGTASVQLNVNLARKGQGIYRGYTTDPRRARPGDHCAVISTNTHTEVVTNPPYGCVGGNTGSSNVANGGMVMKTQRRGQIVGYMLIRDPA